MKNTKLAKDAVNHVWYRISGKLYFFPEPKTVERLGQFVLPSGYLYKVTGWDDTVDPSGLTFEKVGKCDSAEVSRLLAEDRVVVAVPVFEEYFISTSH